jgi:hypothetical protein
LPSSEVDPLDIDLFETRLVARALKGGDGEEAKNSRAHYRVSAKDADLSLS